MPQRYTHFYIILSRRVFAYSCFGFDGSKRIFNQEIYIVQNILHRWHVNNKYIIIFLFIMIVANSIFEEIYWRGYIFRKLTGKINIQHIILFTSGFYASYHLITTINLFSLTYALLFTSVIFLAGIYWGYVRHKYASIYIPVISHLFADLGIMLIYIRYFK